MAGSWHLEQDNEEDSKQRDGWDRWAHEREAVGRMIDAAAEQGIEIEMISSG